SSPVSFIGVGREAINNKRQIALTVILEDKREFVLRLDTDELVFPNDQCPTDNAKFEPGICGCGVSDADSNSDGILDCRINSTVHSMTQTLLGLVRKLKALPDNASAKRRKTAKSMAKEVK